MSTHVSTELPLTYRATCDLGKMYAFNRREEILHSYYKTATRPRTLC